MASPKEFEGKIEIPITNSFGFFPEDDEKNTFTVWFYRRETEEKSLKEFLKSITEENIGYDKPTNQLFYRSESGKLYRMDFTEVK